MLSSFPAVSDTDVILLWHPTDVIMRTPMNFSSTSAQLWLTQTLTHNQAFLQPPDPAKSIPLKVGKAFWNQGDQHLKCFCWIGIFLRLSPVLDILQPPAPEEWWLQMSRKGTWNLQLTCSRTHWYLRSEIPDFATLKNFDHDDNAECDCCRSTAFHCERFKHSFHI